MKIKRTLPLILALFMVGGAFAGCTDGNKNEEDEHVHSYHWVDNGDGTHNEECQNDGCDTPVRVTNEAHVDESGDNKCDRCGADMTPPEQGDDDDDENGDDGDETFTSTPLPASNKIYLVGDSTVCSFNDTGYYLPRYGYGTQISSYFNVTDSQVVNIAASGRSSYSYMTESAADYNKLTGIGAGDYLFIGFGHNDEKAEEARYADPTLASDNDTTLIGTYDAERPISFKYILKHYYIDVALEAGATPILCTPISRLFADSSSSKYNTDHTTSNSTVDGVTYTGGDYAQAIRELGEELDLTVVDMLAMTQTEYKELGYAEASKYHASTGAKWVDNEHTAMVANAIDGTHTNLYGAKNNAYYLATAIKSSSSTLKNHVKDGITKPTYADFGAAAVNSNYKIPDKEPFNPDTEASKIWTSVTESVTDATTGTEYKWYGTLFGAGANASNFKITQGEDDNGITFTISADASKGKIESAQDILAAVFIQLPVETAFTMSATVNATVNEKQSGYGIMVRDDIYVDDFTSTVNSNYLNAGCYTSDGSSNILHWRVDAKLSKYTNVSGYEGVCGTHQLSLTRLSQNTTLTFDTTSTKLLENQYNIDLSDSEYVYVCLWATRGATVTFSNIQFATTTWQQA